MEKQEQDLDQFSSLWLIINNKKRAVDSKFLPNFIKPDKWPAIKKLSSRAVPVTKAPTLCCALFMQKFVMVATGAGEEEIARALSSMDTERKSNYGV